MLGEYRVLDEHRISIENLRKELLPVAPLRRVGDMTTVLNEELEGDESDDVERISNVIRGLSFNRDDLLGEFKKDRPILTNLTSLSKYSLQYIVTLLFRQPDGRPLELLPFQANLLDMLWSYKYPMVLASRGAGKTFIYGLYALLRAILIPGQQIVVIGAGFRQAKLVFNYIVKLYQASPLIQEALGGYGGPKNAVDQCYIKCGTSTIFAIPLGDGERIRGLRATCILCDEFGSIPEDIYEIVVQPFAAVHADPARRAKMTSLQKKLIEHKAPVEITDLITKALGFGNQIAVSGTASYEFNHFYRRYAMYKRIIMSNGKTKQMRQAFLEGNLYLAEEALDEKLLKSFKHTDYAVFQLPYHGIPEGFMDGSVIANARLTLEPSRFGMEYLCKFAKDSDGFFKRSLLDEATPSMTNDGYEVNIELFGEKGAQYVMGIDPARHNDNLAITILKLTGRGFEVVYCWALSQKDWPTATKKVRDLLRRFNIVYIAMDQGGGGASILDLLHDIHFMEDGDEPIWAMDDDDNKFQPGRHIVDMFQWSNQWVREANYAMHAEFRHRQILLPHKASYDYALAQYATHARKGISKLSQGEREWVMEELYGCLSESGDRKTLGIWDNIQIMTDEICNIVKKVTESGSELFILPPLSSSEKQGKLTDPRRRDRYSSILLAAYAARCTRGTGWVKKMNPGGTVQRFNRGGNTQTHHRGPGGVVFPSC